MARIRTVKPEMAQDEDLAACSIEAQLLAIRLLNHSDDEGFFKANVALVKAACFPLIDSLNIHGMLIELSKCSYLWLGIGSDGKSYGWIRNFLKHQKVNRPYASKIKPLVNVTECSVNGGGTITTGMEWNGMEKEEEKKILKEKKQTKTKFTAKTFQQEWIDEARQKPKYCHLNLETEAEQFGLHHEIKATSFTDWKKAWWYWLNNAVKFDRQKGERSNETAAQDEKIRQQIERQEAFYQ